MCLFIVIFLILYLNGVIDNFSYEGIFIAIGIFYVGDCIKELAREREMKKDEQPKES